MCKYLKTNAEKEDKMTNNKFDHVILLKPWFISNAKHDKQINQAKECTNCLIKSGFWVYNKNKNISI